MTYIDNKKINYVHDLMHEILVFRYESKKETYLTLLIELCNYLTDQIDRDQVDYSLEIKQKIDEIEKYDYNSEEIRLVMQLLIVSGLKHKNIPLDVMTPDGIALMFAFIIKGIFNNKNELSILDLAVGTGNLLLSIANHIESKEVTLTGIEHNELLIQVAKANADMQYHEIDLFFQDALQHTFLAPDIIIADFDTYEYNNNQYQSKLYQLGVRDFPYLAIEKHLGSGHEGTFHLYLIPNDFFSRPHSQEMKQLMDEYCEMLALIVLPNSMFVDQSKSKSMLLLKNKPTNTKAKRQCEVIHLPSSEHVESFSKVLQYISALLVTFTQ